MLQHRLAALFLAQSRDEIDRTLDFADEHGLRPVLLGGRDAAECIDRLQSSDTAVVLQVNPGKKPEVEAPKAADKLSAAQAQSEKLNGKTVQIAQKAGVDGRLFGSVTNFDVASGLGKLGFDVAKAQVRMPNGPLKTVGEHAVSVALHTDVVVDITVNVVAEAD